MTTSLTERLETATLKAGAFCVTLPDGTKAVVMGGVVQHVFVAGERPNGWEHMASEARRSTGIAGYADPRPVIHGNRLGSG